LRRRSNKLRPEIRPGRVWSVEVGTQTAEILFPGNTNLVRVHFGLDKVPTSTILGNLPDGTDISSGDYAALAGTTDSDIVRVAGKPNDWWIIDFIKGSPVKVDTVFDDGGSGSGNDEGYQDSFTVLDPTIKTFNLTYRPRPGSTVHMWWNNLPQADDTWTIDGWTVTVDDSDNRIQSGDTFFFKYFKTDSAIQQPSTYDAILASLEPDIDLKFEETTGTTAIDEYGNVNGTYLSNIILNQAPICKAASKSIKTTSDPEAVDIPIFGRAGTTMMWWNFWFKFGSASSSFSTALWSSSGSSGFWTANLGGSNPHRIGLTDTGSGGQVVDNATRDLILDGNPHMITFQFDDATHTAWFWVDGVLKYTWVHTGISVFDPANPLKLGNYANVSQYTRATWGRFTSGRTRLLTDSDVAALYAVGHL
jgi:hypothetical protein